MNNCKYKLRVDLLQGDRITYGIDAIDINKNTVITSIYNISENDDKVQACVDLINKHNLSIIHLLDIVSDLFD